MSDYHFETGVLRDQMASALANNTEQTGYVLAELAKALPRGTRDFDDLMDFIHELDQDQKDALSAFCLGITEAIGIPEAEEE